MEAIDYTSAFNNVPSPVQAFTQGLQGGAAVQQVQFQQQQQQLAAQRQQALQAEYARVAGKPDATADDYSRLMLLDPQSSEQIQRSWTTRNTAQQQAHASDLAQWGAAIKSKNPQVAADAMNDRADAMENTAGGPTPESQAMRANAQLVVIHPELALGKIQAMLAANPNGKQTADALASFNAEQRASDQAPADLLKKTADASKAVSEAQVAAGTVPALIDKPTQENLTAESQRKIAGMNVAIAQANSETERGKLTLERDKYIQEQAKLNQAQGVDTQNQLDTLSNSIATVKSLKDDPLLDSWFGVGTTTGKLLGVIPGTENKDFRTRVDTLKSQQFLTQAKDMRGMGALSDAEGARIERAVASLDTDQSKGAFKNALGVIQSTLEKGQAKILASGKLPKTGGAFVLTHPKFGNVTEGMINQMMIANPGSTREQVMQYLGSQ